MSRVMLRSKIHRATLSRKALDYEGSIALDRHLMDAADLLPPPCGRRPCIPTMHFDVPFSRYQDWVSYLPGGDNTDEPNAWLGTYRDNLHAALQGVMVPSRLAAAQADIGLLQHLKRSVQ